MPRLPTALAVLGLPVLPAACHGEPAPAAPDVSLPRIGMVGALPPAETTLVVTVTKEGRIWCGAEEVGWNEYAERAAAHARRSGRAEPLGGREIWISDRDVLFHLDSELPCLAWVMLRGPLYDLDAALPRIHFAVQSDVDGTRGALALFALEATGDREYPPFVRWRISAIEGLRSGGPATLYDELRAVLPQVQRPEGIPAFEVLVEARPSTAWAAALGMVDAALRAGVVHAHPIVRVDESGLLPERGETVRRDALEQLVRACRPFEPHPAWERDGQRLRGGAPPMPAWGPETDRIVRRARVLDEPYVIEDPFLIDSALKHR